MNIDSETMMGRALQSRARPPHFRECTICHREFGSRSLEIHMGRCLDLQRAHQQILSSDPDSDINEATRRRSNTKGQKYPLRLNKIRNSRPSFSDEDEVETSLSDELTNSW